MAEQVRLALVGCGGISAAHVKGYSDLYARGSRDLVYTACCDVSEDSARRRAAELAEIQGVEPAVFTDPERLLSAKVAEAADLCLPHWLHHSLAIPLLEGGLHVMVEKPVGITIKASKRLIAAAQQAGRILATAENIRRYATARAGNWALNQAKLAGDIDCADIYWVAYGPFDVENPSMKWRLVKLLVGGGMIMDSGAHFGDMMLVLFGEPDEIYCQMAAHDHRMVQNLPILGSAPADVEDSWHAVIRFKNGANVNWTYSRAHPGPALRYGRYYGSEGIIEDAGFAFHCFQGGCSVRYSDDNGLSKDDVLARYKASLAPEELERLFPYGCEDGFGVQLWDFCDAIRSGRAPEMDGEAGLRAKALCESCYESATLGQPVKYDDVLSGAVCTYQAPIDAYWGL